MKNKILKIKNKRGELTTQQIVLLIVLIIGFAIIIFFLFKLNLGNESDKQLCHNSVMTRANKAIPMSAVPLNCKKNYVCITKKKDCEAFAYYDYKIKVKSKDDVYEALANELADCWWMFGEGKVDYVGKDNVEKLYCSLCSQIAFDDSVKEFFNDKDSFKEKEFYEFLINQKYSEEKTYGEYLYGTKNLDAISGELIFEELSLDSQYYALMGIASEISTLKWVLVGAGVVGVVAGSIALTPLTAGASWGFTWAALSYLAGGAVVGGVGGSFVAPVIKGLNGKDMIPPTLVKAGSEEFKALNCDYLTTLS